MSEDGAVQQTAVSRGDFVRYENRGGIEIEAKVIGETEFGFQLDNGAVIEESELEVQDLDR